MSNDEVSHCRVRATATFAAISVGLSLAWLGFVVAIGREHWRRAAESEAELAREPHGLVPSQTPAAPQT